MRARTGKIARLPGPIRHELNRCLHNGTLGKEFDIWLNELAEVQCVLAHCFAGRLVTEDNISAWRQGGFRDWLRFHPESGLLGPSGAYQQGGWGSTAVHRLRPFIPPLNTRHPPHARLTIRLKDERAANWRSP